MVRNKRVLACVLVAGLFISGCGEKTTEGPVTQSTAVEAIAKTEESTEAETEAEPETETPAEKTVASSEDAEATLHYDYEVFTDDESHRVIYWTDGVTQHSQPFRSLKLPGWGIESISLPAGFVVPEDGKEIYVANVEDDTDDYVRLAEEKALVDDSYGYPGAWSRRDEYDMFRVWRVEVDEAFDFENAYPEEIYQEVYPFIDGGAFLVEREKITKYKNPDGTTDYLLTCHNRGHWGNIKKTGNGYETSFKKMYEGYILVRPRGNVAHCIFYATTDPLWKEMCAYIFNYSAVLTDVEDITEGFVCKKAE